MAGKKVRSKDDELLDIELPSGLAALFKRPDFFTQEFTLALSDLKERFQVSTEPLEANDTDAPKRRRAVVIVASAQAIHWRRKYDRLRKLLADEGYSDAVANAEFRRFQAEGGIFGRLGLSEESKVALEATIKKWNYGKGRREVSSSYRWLDDWHELPRLRTALGLSDEGAAKMAKKLRVKIVRSPTRKKVAGKVGRVGALKMLEARLARPHGKGQKVAQEIWDNYACAQVGAGGFDRLRRVLKLAGADCATKTARTLGIFAPPQ